MGTGSVEAGTKAVAHRSRPRLGTHSQPYDKPVYSESTPDKLLAAIARTGYRMNFNPKYRNERARSTKAMHFYDLARNHPVGHDARNNALRCLERELHFAERVMAQTNDKKEQDAAAERAHVEAAAKAAAAAMLDNDRLAAYQLQLWQQSPYAWAATPPASPISHRPVWSAAPAYRYTSFEERVYITDRHSNTSASRRSKERISDPTGTSKQWKLQYASKSDMMKDRAVVIHHGNSSCLT